MPDSDALPDPEMISGRIHSVETLGALDGPGLRYVVFLQGCPLQCAYCHNPDSRAYGIGDTQTADSLTDQILRYRHYLTGGVTFSGGEPLIQAEFVRAVTRLLHQRAQTHVAIDTSGAVFSQDARTAIDEADLILLDIKAFQEETSIRLTGCDTKNSKAILDYCEATHKDVWIRHVLVPGFTIFDTKADGTIITDDGDFEAANPAFCAGISDISRFTCVKKTELLPFHKMGEYKWREIGLVSPLENIPEPSETCVNWARRLVSATHPGKS